MIKKPCKIETDVSTTKWMESLRACASHYMKDEGCPFLIANEEQARLRGFIVVPIPELWNPSRESVLPGLKARTVKRIYATGVDLDKELFLSAPTKKASLTLIVHYFNSVCLLAPRNEEFFIFHTRFGYWFLASPPALVEGIMGMSLTDAFLDFQHFATVIDHEEPGPQVALDILRRYHIYNQEMLAKMRCSVTLM